MSELDLGGVPVYGIVHENLGEEPLDFFDVAFGSKHAVLLDSHKAFLPHKNQGAISLFSMGALRNTLAYTMSDNKLPGNIVGDYAFHGAVLVVGPGDQGIVYESLEGSFGDRADSDALLKAVRAFAPGSPQRSHL